MPLRQLDGDQASAVYEFAYANEFWVYARKYLRDAFCLFEPLGYRVGKLTSLGI